MILMGLRYLASSIPLIALAGVAIGVGIIFAFLVLSLENNPTAFHNRCVIGIAFGFNLAEASGFIYIVYSFLLLYALNGNFGYIKNTATSKTEAAQILY